MIDNSVVAGIVLYNPNLTRLFDNINSCLSQVKHIVLIDNNSRNIDKVISKYSNNPSITIIKNSKNLGIAHGLNQIMGYAQENGYDYFLTLDQDSVMEDSYISLMFKEAKSISNWAVLSPRIKDVNLPSQSKKSGIEEIQNAKEVISSGCLIRLCAAEAIQGFDDKLFIDYVDTDFNQRILLAGYKIIRVQDAVLHHELGYSQYHKLFGYLILVDNHNAFRRYYITRNRLYYSYKYNGKSGYYKEKIKVFCSGIKILLYEDDKTEKIRAIMRGMRDANSLL